MNNFPPFGFDFMFALFPVMFFLVFGLVLFTFIRGINTYFKNNRQPVVPVEATVAAKRYSVSHRHHNTGEMHSTTESTSYYVTFEFKNRERLELHVPSSEFGMLVEGDMGILSFQGTRYISFIRN